MKTKLLSLVTLAFVLSLISISFVMAVPYAVNDSFTIPYPLTALNGGSMILNDDFELAGIYSDFYVQVITNPLKGNVVYDAWSGLFNYTTSGFRGEDYFEYILTNGTDSSLPAKVTIIYSGYNTAPVANADNYTLENLSSFDGEYNITGNVSLNDFDAENDSFSVILNQNVINGTLALNADGSFVYAPYANFSGIDYFSYHLYDGMDNSLIVNVTLYIDYSAPIVIPEENITPKRNNEGSGGGGTCETKWNCTQWTECNNGTQTRNCSFKANFCKPTDAKPSERKTCTVANNTINNTNVSTKGLG